MNTTTFVEPGAALVQATYSWLGPAFMLIVEEYKDRQAQRSRVPLMKHIIVGLSILAELSASRETLEAYCLHPLVQNDEDLKRNWRAISDTQGISPGALILVMEYRRAANAYLCRPDTDAFTQADIAKAVGYLLQEVKQLLIADKRQNQADFRTYHLGAHERSAQLEAYFSKWLVFLGQS